VPRQRLETSMSAIFLVFIVAPVVLFIHDDWVTHRAIRPGR